VVFLAAVGCRTKAFVLTLWELLVAGLVEHLLRPILMGNQLNLHSVVSLLSVVSGILVFGPAGCILELAAFTVTTARLEISFGVHHG